MRVDRKRFLEWLTARTIKRTKPNLVPDGEIWISDKSYEELKDIQTNLEQVEIDVAQVRD